MNGMTYGSCRFLFHQFIQRDEDHKIAADVDTLASLSTAPMQIALINTIP